jgi:branched-chain amino acid transport system substrate-binding protein
MRTWILVLAVLAFITPVRADSDFHVGAIMALSGDGAGYGEALRNGMEMALADLPPEVREKIKIHYEDDGLVSKNTISAFQRLSSLYKLDAVITFSSGTSNAIVSLTERAEVPLLAIALDYKVCKDKKYAFNFWVTPEEESGAVFKEILKRGYKKIARISATHDGTFALNKAFDKFNENGEVEIILDEDYPIEVKDFKSYLTKLRHKKGLDAIFINLLPGQVGLFAKQAREMKINVPLFDVELFEDNNEVKNSNGALIGQWYVNADEGDLGFQKRYKEKFPNATSYASGNGYDLVMHFKEAYLQGLKGKEVAKYFHNLKDYKGALGTYSATGDNRFTMPACVKVVKENGFEKLN